MERVEGKEGWIEGSGEVRGQTQNTSKDWGKKGRVRRRKKTRTRGRRKATLARGEQEMM